MFCTVKGKMLAPWKWTLVSCLVIVCIIAHFPWKFLVVPGRLSLAVNIHLYLFIACVICILYFCFVCEFYVINCIAKLKFVLSVDSLKWFNVCLNFSVRQDLSCLQWMAPLERACLSALQRGRSWLRSGVRKPRTSKSCLP